MVGPKSRFEGDEGVAGGVGGAVDEAVGKAGFGSGEVGQGKDGESVRADGDAGRFDESREQLRLGLWPWAPGRRFGLDTRVLIEVIQLLEEFERCHRGMALQADAVAGFEFRKGGGVQGGGVHGEETEEKRRGSGG
ncbi:MAG: hypothetical protein NTW21_18285 [Verrucomicrobia bacterium]|nr:hypothetical protein [Verrucomicrobiota bacterium]